MRFALFPVCFTVVLTTGGTIWLVEVPMDDEKSLSQPRKSQVHVTYFPKGPVRLVRLAMLLHIRGVESPDSLIATRTDGYLAGAWDRDIEQAAKPLSIRIHEYLSWAAHVLDRAKSSR